MCVNGFIKLNRCKKTEELLNEPACFMLLTQIAYRARRSNDFTTSNLKVGEALIGDWQSIGLSSEKVYRTAKKKLENWGFVSFKGTNRGTVATLLDSEIYDINVEQKGEQGANKGRAEGEQGATNKNDKKDKNEKEQPVAASKIEVQEYFTELTGVNGEYSKSFAADFVAHYTDKGWPKDWQQAMVKHWLSQDFRKKQIAELQAAKKKNNTPYF